jgi:hypothetical protein
MSSSTSSTMHHTVHHRHHHVVHHKKTVKLPEAPLPGGDSGTGTPTPPK